MSHSPPMIPTTSALVVGRANSKTTLQQQARPPPSSTTTMQPTPPTKPPTQTTNLAASSRSSTNNTQLTTYPARPPSSTRRGNTVLSSELSLDGASYASSLVLDLRDQAYNDLHILNAKFPAKVHQSTTAASSSTSSKQQSSPQSVGYPWSIIILSGNMLSKLDGLHRCTFLRKLDLSRNGIEVLPKAAFWKQLKHLQILFLHQNKIDSIHALQQLSCLPSLEILTCFGNAVEHHPAYRHVMVNVNFKLLLLDFYIVSDAELIEGANWGQGNKYFTYAPTLECDILNVGHGVGVGSNTKHVITGAAGGLHSHHFDGSEKNHLQLLEAQLEIVRKQHRRFSPVLKIQSLFRGVLVRRTIKVYHQASAAIQHCWRRWQARKILNQSEKERLSTQQQVARRGAKSVEPFSEKSNSTVPLNSLAAHTIFLVHTSDVAVSLFMQLVRRVEQAEGVIAPDLTDANMLLLSQANIKDDYPLVKRIFLGRPAHITAGCHLLPGKHCPPNDRHSLTILRPRAAGAIMNEHSRFLLMTRIAQQTYSNRFLQFQSPGSRFHELLIRAVHAYNIEMGNYNETTVGEIENFPPPSLNPSTSDLKQREEWQQRLQLGEKSSGLTNANMNKVIIYPGTTIRVIAAAVTIQSVYRSYRTRKWLEPSLGRRLVVKRAVTCLVRWWRSCLFRLRMHLLTGLKRYGDSINSRHLFCRGDILFLLRSSPNAFVDKEFMPEHRAIFGVEPKEFIQRNGGSAGGANSLENNDAPMGKLTLIVDQKSSKRFYPFPRWLANHWGHQPLPVLHGFTDAGVRVDLSSRMTELIKEGVHISVLPDVSQVASLESKTGMNDGWNASNFIKLSFATVEEARNRALTLAINTWLPSFHLLNPSRHNYHPLTSSTPSALLAGSSMAFLMTPQHMTLCLQYQQAGGPSGSAGERHILYTTFWTKSRQAPASLYSNQAYLDLQYQLKLVEEAHIAAERLELGVPASRSDSKPLEEEKRSSEAVTLDDEDEIVPVVVPGVSTYNPSIFALKRESASSERLMSRRMVAQARVKIHTEKLVAQEQARQQTVMHRIKMEHLAEREIAARRQRQLDYERMDAAARAARDRLLAAKHAFVHQFKHDLAQRAKLRELDKELDSKELRKRVNNEKLVTQKHLQERYEMDEDKVHEKVMLKKSDQQRHRRLLEEKENTLAFMSQQNMISRQLTVGMRNRLKLHQQQKTAATVQARREVAHQRRHQVHQILFENFNRRRQTALAQQVELKNHVQLRTLKDENKVNLMRARRQHLNTVKALATSAALSTLNSGLLQQSHPSNFSQTQPLAQLRPGTSGNQSGYYMNASSSASINPSSAYLPNSSLRQVSGGLFAPPTTSVPGSTLPPIRARTPTTTNVGGDQLALQMNVLRDLAERVKLQYQTSIGGQHRAKLSTQLFIDH